MYRFSNPANAVRVRTEAPKERIFIMKTVSKKNAKDMVFDLKSGKVTKQLIDHFSNGSNVFIDPHSASVLIKNMSKHLNLPV